MSSGVSTSPVGLIDSTTPCRRAPGARKPGVSGFEEQVVDPAPVLPADLDHVLEARRGEETRAARPCAPALRWWRPSCRGRTARRCRPRCPNPGAGAPGRCAPARSGRHGKRAPSRCAGVRRRADCDDVGEGAADIDADWLDILADDSLLERAIMRCGVPILLGSHVRYRRLWMNPRQLEVFMAVMRTGSLGDGGARARGFAARGQQVAAP